MNPKIILKKIFLTICAAIGYALCMPLVTRKIRKGHTWRIIRYHSVSDRRRHETNVTVDAFRTQMAHLKSACRVISLQEGVDWIVSQNGFDEECVSVTFDDGYMDNYLNAYPVLKANAIPSVIFLISGFIGTRHILPHDETDDPGANHLLTWEQIADMDPALIQCGSHTSSHFRLCRCSEEIYQKEIVGSKKMIEEHTKKNVRFISYPFGTASDFTDAWKSYLKNTGFLAGYLATYGWNDVSGDLFALKRIGIESSDSLFTFKAKLDGALDPLLLLSETSVGRGLKKMVNKLLGAVDYE